WTARHRRWSIFCGMLLFGLLFILPDAVSASEPVDEGYRTVYGVTGGACSASPTGEKPESKLWFHDGSWWSVLCTDDAEAHGIFRLDSSSQDWIDTQTEVYDRPGAKADTLWDETAQKLYITFHTFTKSGASSSESQWGR